MSFLPIVQRELRVAARRRSTFKIRWWAALIALGLSFVSLAWVQASGNRSGVGNSVFGLLTFYVFGLCLLAGVLLSADALSEEKRLGTLGLLFLTDLHGYDVVLGKFMAQWLSAFYCLLALLPALALPLLLGGVTGGEFWRMVLALSNMLFFSLAVGLLVSALGRDSRKTMANTLWLLLLLSVAAPLLAGVGGKVSPSPVWAYLNLVTPSSPFIYAGELPYVRQPGMFRDSLLGSSCLAFSLLALASFVLPHAWQERARQSIPSNARGLRVSARNITGNAKTRVALLRRNPVLWLANDQLGTQWGAWIIVLLWGVLVIGAVLLQPGETMTPVLGSYAVLPFGFCLKLLFGLQAGRLFAENRRNGALELLLCTPLTSGEIIRGQMLAVARTFCWPLVAFTGLLFAPIAIHLAASLIQADWHQTTLVLGGSLIGLLYTARFGVDLWALCFFAMGLALSLRRPQLTPALTIIFVLVLPSILSFCLLDMLADIIFIAWGANKCRRDLRGLVVQ